MMTEERDDERMVELMRVLRELEVLDRQLKVEDLVRLYRAAGPELSRRAFRAAFPPTNGGDIGC